VTAREVYRFGAFTLDIGERRLSAASDVRLSPKTFDVLAALVQHRGRLVTKHELLARVWPETFVEEGILTVHVAALRKALGDETRPRLFIETVPRSGYRFVAAVTSRIAGRVSAAARAGQAPRALRMPGPRTGSPAVGFVR
jgi:DNA-binding winged helix-turn-helix (wHTH) protein